MAGLTLAGGWVAGALALSGWSAPPPQAPLPRDAPGFARALVRAHAGVDRAARVWQVRERLRGRAPRELELEALFQQRLYVALSGRPSLRRDVVVRLPAGLRDDARDLLEARRALLRLTPPTTRSPSSFRTAPPPPARRLLAHYREAQRRFGVPWNVLAAVHFVETKLGRVRSDSSAGAQGPMQFLPSTWARYGLGGNVHRTRDAILGAANYLGASGAPRHLWAALHAYNRSPLYVEAVLRYARRMRSVRGFLGLYAWQVFIRTPAGARRITGPGLR